ncbi:MAG: hypothetical protein Kow0080_26290 [Candidatus Promineifilaceae bacterium]
MLSENSRPWWQNVLWVLLGFAAGVGLGLYLGWVAWPTEFVDANPALLQDAVRRDYARMIADQFALDGDLAQAQAQIDALGEDGRSLLLQSTTDAILANEPEPVIQRLVNLSTALGLSSPVMVPYLAAPNVPEGQE